MIKLNQWMGIEYAPLDGTAVLVMNDDCPGTKSGRAEECGAHNTAVAVYWGDDDHEYDPNNWYIYNSAVEDPMLHFEPTHWMPLPEPPIRSETSGEEGTKK